MNIYQYINSKDVRKYLQEIQYQFTTAEAAFVVYWCKHVALDEKIEAWQDIIRTMPDCSMEKRLNMMQIDSFHAFLEKYIALQKQDIHSFYAGDDCIYSYEYHETESEYYEWDDRWYGKFDLFFCDYSSCMSHCRKELLTNDNVDGIRIFKCLLNQTGDMPQNHPDIILFNNKLEIMDVIVSHEEEDDFELNYAFEGMCFNFPTPFRRGDILVNYAMHGMKQVSPFVLSYISTWDSKELLSKGFSEHEWPFQGELENHDKFVKKLLKINDASDMNVFGTEICDGEGTLDTDVFLIIPIDLEYYREPLIGVERQLQVLSCYEKGEIDALQLANCCSAIRIEEYSEKINCQCTGIYTKDIMEQCGMLSAEE